MNDGVNALDRARGQTGACQGRIEGGEIGGAQRLQTTTAEVAADMGKRADIALDRACGQVQGHPIAQEPIQEVAKRDPRGIDGAAALRLGDQLGTLDLCLALGALERVPAAFALALRVVSVNDDTPMTWRPFADVTFHDLSPDLQGANAEGGIPSRVSMRNSIWSMRFSIRSKTRWASGESGDSTSTLCVSRATISEFNER